MFKLLGGHQHPMQHIMKVRASERTLKAPPHPQVATIAEEGASGRT